MIRQSVGRLVGKIALASVVVVLFALPAAAQGMIQGTVVDAQGQPVDGAKITIEQTEGVTRKFETKTDKKGAFIQIGLQSAGYKVTAEKDKLGTATANTRVSQRGPASVRLVIGGGAANDPAVAAKTAELRKAFDEGVAQSRAGQYDESIESFNKALAVNPNCQDCLYNIGYAYAQKKELDKAEENYKKAILVKPDYAEAYNGLANIYNAQRKFDEAAAASAKANELTASAPGGLAGGNADSLYNQGVILWNSGKIPEAKKLFEQAIAANPNHAESHYQLAMALVNEGKLAEAGDRVQHVSQACARRPERRDGKGAGRAATEVVSARSGRPAGGRSRSHRARRRPGPPRSLPHPPRLRLQDLRRRSRPRRRARRADRLRRKQGPGSAAEARGDRGSPAALASHRPSAVEQGGEGGGPVRRDSLDRRRGSGAETRCRGRGRRAHARTPRPGRSRRRDRPSTAPARRSCRRSSKPRVAARPSGSPA